METIRDYVKNYYSASLLVNGYPIMQLIANMSPSEFEDFMQTEVTYHETRPVGQYTALWLSTR